MFCGDRQRSAFHLHVAQGKVAQPSSVIFKVCTQSVPDCAKSMLQVIMPGKVESKSVIYSDGLVDVG